MSFANAALNVINLLRESLNGAGAPLEIVNEQLVQIGGLALEHDLDRKIVAFRFTNGGGGVLCDFRTPASGLPELARRVAREWILQHIGQAFARHDLNAGDVYNISSDKVTLNKKLATVVADSILTTMTSRERPFDYLMAAVAELHRIAGILISVADDLELLFAQQFHDHGAQDA